MTEPSRRARDSIHVIDDVDTDLLPFLRSAILAREASGEPSHGSNNVGGWKSGIDFFDSPTSSPIRRLRDSITACAVVAGITPMNHTALAWAMINRDGSFHKRHTHGLGYTVGVYYVAAGDPPTPTIFEMPRGEQEVLPVPGRLVLFWGGIFHRVPIYLGTEPRISIAFELRP